MSENCVCCGASIPEGRQVCQACEQRGCMHIWVYDGMGRDKQKRRVLRYVCRTCGAVRTETPKERLLPFDDEKRFSGLIEED